MKSIYIFSALICINATLHAMEQNNQLALPDWKGIHNQLINDYKDILKTKLEEYKKSDISIAPLNMDELFKVGTIITKFNHSYLVYNLFLNTHDKQTNSFFHIAVEKNDIPTVKWLSPRIMNNQYLTTNNDGKTPFDLCIKKLLPYDIYKRASEIAIARQIFDIMLSGIGKLRINPHLKEKCLTATINLQLNYAAYYGTPCFKVDPDLLTKLLKAERLEKEPSLISRFYKEAKNESGSTFAHIFVLLLRPDELFKLVKKDHVSFAKDNRGQSALTWAINTLKIYTAKITTQAEAFQRASCCVYILLNHAKSLAQKNILDVPADISDFGPCCEKHMLSKGV
jgi:hypothetical protein